MKALVIKSISHSLSDFWSLFIILTFCCLVANDSFERVRLSEISYLEISLIVVKSRESKTDYIIITSLKFDSFRKMKQLYGSGLRSDRFSLSEYISSKTLRLLESTRIEDLHLACNLLRRFFPTVLNSQLVSPGRKFQLRTR